MNKGEKEETKDRHAGWRSTKVDGWRPVVRWAQTSVAAHRLNPLCGGSWDLSPISLAIHKLNPYLHGSSWALNPPSVGAHRFRTSSLQLEHFCILSPVFPGGTASSVPAEDRGPHSGGCRQLCGECPPGCPTSASLCIAAISN